MRKVGIVIFDMDDTLVDKETVFVEAQKTMLQTMAEHDPRIDPDKDLGILREIDHELVRLHGGKHAYKSWKLAEALWLHYHEGKGRLEAATLAFKLKKSNVEHSCITKAAKRHDNILENRIPRLINGAKEVLRELKKKYVLVLFPSGKEKSQQKVIKHLGLDKIFDVIFICEVKNASAFLKAKRRGEEVLSKAAGKSKRIVMIGDRISQDIIPAKEVGLETIWIPGPYFPGNRQEGMPDHEISSLCELLKLL